MCEDAETPCASDFECLTPRSINEGLRFMFEDTATAYPAEMEIALPNLPCILCQMKSDTLSRNQCLDFGV
jgi:hypothetical protein